MQQPFVDYAGLTVLVFEAVLRASSYCYAEATWGQGEEGWIRSYLHALELFGGSPEVLVTDYVPGDLTHGQVRADHPPQGDQHVTLAREARHRRWRRVGGVQVSEIA